MHSGDLRPGSSTFIMFFDLNHACCWTWRHRWKYREITLYVSPTHLLVPWPHLGHTPCSCTERGVFFLASLTTLEVPGGGLSDGLKLSEQYVCVLRDVCWLSIGWLLNTTFLTIQTGDFCRCKSHSYSAFSIITWLVDSIFKSNPTK